MNINNFNFFRNVVITVVLSALVFFTFFYISIPQNNIIFKNNVVFYVQHQDDEALWAGSTIINAINKVGSKNVYVVLVSKGSGIKVFDKDEKYKNLTVDDKFKIRNNEFFSSLSQLGVQKNNILIIPEKYPNSDYFNSMRTVALNYEKKLKSVTHIAHTFKYDDHSQHLKNGLVIQNLFKKGLIKDAKYFVKPKFEDKIPSSNKIICTVNSTKDYNKVKNACHQYKFVDSSKLREGIGYKSDHKSFDKILENKSAPSILHTPYV